MKTTTIILVAILVSGPACFALSFDTGGFGLMLNGWKANRTTSYQLTDGHYRTHVPTITATPSGGMFLSTQVDLVVAGGKGATCHIGLTFSSDGALEMAQIKGTVENKALDTGLIRRPERPPLPVAMEGETPQPPRPFHATDEMIAELFSAFDAEMKRVVAAGEGERRDFFSRLSKKGASSADLSAGLRHNVNLLLANVKS